MARRAGGAGGDAVLVGQFFFLIFKDVKTKPSCLKKGMRKLSIATELEREVVVPRGPREALVRRPREPGREDGEGEHGEGAGRFSALCADSATAASPTKR